MKRWPTRPVGELVDFLGGGTPRRDHPDYWGGDIPWASVKDLQSQALETTVETITAEGLANSASHLIPEGTVIIASRVGLGKVAINRMPVAINQDLKALTPRTGGLLPRYLLQFLLSKAEYFERSGVGATVKGLTIADYQKLDIAVPTLEEQERIVKLLDEADELRQLRAQADRRTTALAPALFHEMFGDPVTNPKGWPVFDFGQLLAEPLRNGLSPAKDGTHPAKVFTLSAITGERFNAAAWKDASFARLPDKDCQTSERLFLICRGNGNRELVGRGKFPSGVGENIVLGLCT